MRVVDGFIDLVSSCLGCRGAIILGIGGDNSDTAVGTFYEGLITAGFTTDAADDAVQADIVAAGYGK